MSNKSISFLAALTAVTTMLSSFSLVVAAAETKPAENSDNTESISADISKEIEEITEAEETRDVISDFSLVTTETKSAENPDVTEGISADISEETDKITEAKSVEVINAESLEVYMPIVAIASNEDSEMIAQVIIIKNDGTDDTEESDISAIKPGESYTFEISNLNITSDNLGGFCLTFDFGEHPNFFEENVEKINIDVNSIKIDGVEFNIDPERKNLNESNYNNGFALFPLISGDSEHFNEVFLTDSETSETGKVAESISIGITVNELVLKEDESDVPEETTTTATETTTTATESITETTESTKSTNINTVSNTTKATTKVTTIITTNNNVIPSTGDSGVGAVVALLATSASLAFVIKKRKK